MKRSTILGIVVVVIVVVTAGVYLGLQNNNGSTGGAGPAPDHLVTIANFAFDPNIITVHVGDTVTWKNNDGVNHRVASDTNSTVSFGSSDLGTGSTYAFTFTAAGDYWYHCAIHSSTAHAIVRVLPVLTG